MQWFGELNRMWCHVAGIVIAILVPWIQRRSKRLSCSYSTSLLAVTHHYREQLEVHYLGQRVHAASVVDLTLRNTGNQSIRKLDFESPIRLGFGRAAHLLTYEVIATVPSALRPSSNRQAAKVATCERARLKSVRSFSIPATSCLFDLSWTTPPTSRSTPASSA